MTRDQFARVKQAELFGAVEQAFDGGGRPAGSAPWGALIHGLELRADLCERQSGLALAMPATRASSRSLAGLRRRGPEQGGIGEPFDDEAFDGALQFLDRPARRGRGVGSKAKPSRFELRTRATSSQR